MEFIKNNLKVMIAFIVGIILAGGIVYAATYANQVTYGTDKNVKISTVEEALNDLYANMRKTPDTVTLIENIDYWNYSISFNPSDYKYFIMTDTQWNVSQKVYSTMISQLAISSIQNASYIESGVTGRNADSSSVAARSYIIIPDGSGEDITITYVGSDATCVYGVK